MIALLLVAQVAGPPGAYRLAGNALAIAGEPSGVLALSGSARESDVVFASALLWVDAEKGQLDALVATVEVRSEGGRAAARFGRMLLAPGALVPVHFDGVTGVVRLDSGTSAELFLGAPVVPAFAHRGGDWLVGARAAQRFGSYGHLGLAIQHRTDDGAVSDQELAVDALFVPLDRIDIAVRAAWDIASRGFRIAGASGGVTLGDWRWAVTAQHRSPARSLPATSLFSVLGDTANNLVGVTVDWQAAPRLDLSSTAGMRHVGGWGEDLRLAATLRLDDGGPGALGVVVTHAGTPDAAWSGVRAWLRVPVVARWVVSSEAELARTQDGEVWPWALLALTWSLSTSWEIAGAVEASVTPSYERAVLGIARVGYRWSGP